VVSEKCEPDYVRAKPLRRAAEREVSTCWQNAARDLGTEGSAYRSWAAYCAASVHDRYSGRALRDKRLSPDGRSKAQPPPDFGWVEAVRREAEFRFDPDELELLKARMTDGFTFVDVGANIGAYTQPSDRRVPLFGTPPTPFGVIVHSLGKRASSASIEVGKLLIEQREPGITIPAGGRA